LGCETRAIGEKAAFNELAILDAVNRNPLWN
jgi:hypothetical protein